MSQTEINSLFTAGGIPATGLTPTIRVWEINGLTQTLIIGSPNGTGQNTDGQMIEVTGAGSPGNGDGFYTFLFTNILGYDETKKYLIRTDGSATLPDTDRYQSGEIEPLVDEITNSVWDEDLAPDHQIPGSAGAIVSAIKADTTQLFLDVDTVKNIVDLILKFDTGRTKIDDVAKTLTVYDVDCITPLRVFQLLDQNGTPSTDSVCERKPISATDGVPVCT